MDLSIVIINWNGWTVLRNCLNSLYEAPQGVSFEVIVVDNASSDDSVAAIEREFPQVVQIRNSKNLGFAAANNQAFLIAKGRYVLALNNDTIVLPNALVESVRYLDQEPSCGALGCRVEFPDRSFQTSCYRFNDLLEFLMLRILPLGSVRGERLNIGRYWGKQFQTPTPVDVIAGCYLMVRHEVIQNVGGFDEDFFMYGEDEEWCSRIKAAGWKIIYFPKVTIIHIHRFSSSKARKAHRVIECMSPILVLHKRRGGLVAWAGNILLLIAFLERLPMWVAKDFLYSMKSGSQKGLIKSRFLALGAHLKGLLWPVWLPPTAKAPATLPARSTSAS